MTDQQTAGLGHNNPPDPLETVVSQYDDIISEATNWTDGEPVTTEAQMLSVDALIKGFKTYRADLAKAGKERTEPLHRAWKAEVAAVKVYTDDADRIQAALVASVAPFKATLAEQKEAARRAAWQAAQDAERAAEELARAADVSNLDAQREADAARHAALEAKKAASAAQKDKVKGMRAVQYHDIASMRDLVNWIAANDKPAMAAFAEAYAAKNHKDIPDAIVRSFTKMEAF
jgi:chromosome segregation ATPase